MNNRMKDRLLLVKFLSKHPGFLLRTLARSARKKVVRFKKSLMLALIVFLIAGVSPALAQEPGAQEPYWPTDGWRTSTPEEQGMDSNQLADMLVKIEEQEINIDSVVVIRNGYLVAEAYVGPWEADDLHILYSVTKSVVATLTGIAVDRGYLDSVDQLVLDLLPEKDFDNVDELKEAATLEDFLTMTSGLEWPDEDFGMTGGMIRTRDWIQFVLDRPMAAEPGTTFVYNNGVPHVIAAILEDVTGESLKDFADETLFGPLGIDSYGWQTDPQGITIGGWGLFMKPRDMAKLGYLYLNNGLWDGEQILSSDWIAASTTPHIVVNERIDQGYGYFWWIYPDFYAAQGLEGQFIIVVPAQNMVVVFTSQLLGEDESWPFRLLVDHIIPAVQSDEALPANPDGEARLQAEIEALAGD
jgi:CubicO group peptidase (beta-lactamase class C family)